MNTRLTFTSQPWSLAGPLAGCLGILLTVSACSTAAPATTPAASSTPLVVTVPTVTPVIPEGELGPRLLAVLTTNYKDTGAATCVHDAVMSELKSGGITPTDIDNYVRNVTTDAMTRALVKIQDSGTCKRAS